MSRPAEVVSAVVPAKQIKTSRNGEVKMTVKSRQCPICHVYYKYGNSYWQHVRYVHARILSQCVICEKSYKRTTMTKHHILHSHKIAWHLCSNYVRKIKKSDLSEKKTIRNLKEKKNSNLKFFKKKTLHLISSFNCYDCPESFPSITELFNHVRSHKDSKLDESDSDSEEVDSSCNRNDMNYDKIDSSFEKMDSS